MLNRRELMKSGAGALAGTAAGMFSGCASRGGLTEERAITAKKFAGLAKLPTVMPSAYVKDGARALADAGVKMVYSTFGDRYAYDGDADKLPYGHAFRLENSRRPETALYTRDNYMAALACSICGYNHISPATDAATKRFNKYVYDPDLKMGFRDFCTRPMSCINIHSPRQLEADLDAVKDAEFVGYGNHEQYFFKDYLAYQPEYMEKEMLCAKTLAARGHRFIFMEELV